jgi:hypothetical protein
MNRAGVSKSRGAHLRARQRLRKPAPERLGIVLATPCPASAASSMWFARSQPAVAVGVEDTLSAACSGRVGRRLEWLGSVIDPILQPAARSGIPGDRYVRRACAPSRARRESRTRRHGLRLERLCGGDRSDRRVRERLGPQWIHVDVDAAQPSPTIAHASSRALLPTSHSPVFGSRRRAYASLRAEQVRFRARAVAAPRRSHGRFASATSCRQQLVDRDASRSRSRGARCVAAHVVLLLR